MINFGYIHLSQIEIFESNSESKTIKKLMMIIDERGGAHRKISRLPGGPFLLCMELLSLENIPREGRCNIIKNELDTIML